VGICLKKYLEFLNVDIPTFAHVHSGGENIDRCIIQTIVLCGALCNVLKLSVLNKVLVKCSVNTDYLVLLIQLGRLLYTVHNCIS